MTRNPTHVVYDNAGAGYLFYKDGDGELFTAATAHRFAVKRNRELKRPTYRVLWVASIPGKFTPVSEAEQRV